MPQIRTMRATDIPSVVRLCDQENWGITRSDLKRILHINPRGSFLAVDGTRKLGLITTTSFGRHLAWIGNVIVDRNHRGKDIGRRLVEHAVNYLCGTRVRHIALYCFNENLPFYKHLGFVREASFLRLKRKGGSVRFRNSRFNFDDSPRLDEVLRIDKGAFGADRSKLIRAMLTERAARFIAAYNGSVIKSYIMIKKYEDMCELGPWVSTKPQRNEPKEMLRLALAGTRGKPVETSILRNNRLVLTLLRSHGFRTIKEGYRLYYDERPRIGDDRAQCALGFLDKG
jgi:ribosomal protein S18 acetylase RimI-like enzyme